jgi:hypothetical protein
LALALILASVSAGSAMQEKRADARAILQSLETARVQLSRKAVENNGESRKRALSLVEQAIREMEAGTDR